MVVAGKVYIATARQSFKFWQAFQDFDAQWHTIAILPGRASDLDKPQAAAR